MIFDMFTCKTAETGSYLHVGDCVEIDQAYLSKFYPWFILTETQYFKKKGVRFIGKIVKLSNSGNYCKIMVVKPKNKEIIAPCKVLSLLPVETLLLENEMEI